MPMSSSCPFFLAFTYYIGISASTLRTLSSMGCELGTPERHSQTSRTKGHGNRGLSFSFTSFTQTIFPLRRQLYKSTHRKVRSDHSCQLPRRLTDKYILVNVHKRRIEMASNIAKERVAERPSTVKSGIVTRKNKECRLCRFILSLVP